MTLPDSPDLGRRYCPACEPEADPTREILVTRYCAAHEPRTASPDDVRVSASWLPHGHGEAEGADCRRMAEALRCRTA